MRFYSPHLNSQLKYLQFFAQNFKIMIKGVTNVRLISDIQSASVECCRKFGILSFLNDFFSLDEIKQKIYEKKESKIRNNLKYKLCVVEYVCVKR